MPIIESDYVSPWWLRNAHLSTILPSMYRKVENVSYERERYSTIDGDFLDLDWIRNKGNREVVILTHGLEGSSNRSYITGTARHFSENGMDVLAWNCRSCSGVPNNLPRFYHHADTGDIAELVSLTANMYDEIYLVGYSMGGSISLNYLGQHHEMPRQLKAAAVFSVPVNLGSSVRELSRPSNQFYRKRFLKKLKAKMKSKREIFPNVILTDGIDAIESFESFDARYTAPLHGFEDAADFYEQGSTTNELAQINLPTLIVNALNDPFLGDECYPVRQCEALPKVYLEMPVYGGHVGFALDRKFNSYMDFRPLTFFKEKSR